MKLHEYQKQHVEKITETFRNFNSVLLQMPTGTGKTNVFCQVIYDFYKQHPGKQILILAHRRELIYQIRERMKDFGLFDASDVLISGSQYNKTKSIQIALIQTLDHRISKIDFLTNVSLIVIDEAHHTPSETYRKILLSYKTTKTKLLGVTATPLRLDGTGFADIFEKLLSSQPFRWFIDNHYLCPIKHFASENINPTQIPNYINELGFEEYDLVETERYYSNPKVMADIIESYKKHGENKKAIVFTVTIAHAEKLAKRFQNEGYNAESISGNDGDTTRAEKINRFKKGITKILTNVDIFSEGFDCPDIEVVQIARPTRSLVKYLQMAGRVTRVSNGKSYGILLDNANLWQEHGLVTNDRKWYLDGNVVENREYNDLIFSDGSTGEHAYRRKVSENPRIGLTLISSYGITGTVNYSQKTLAQLKVDYNIGTETIFTFAELIGLDIKEHLKPGRRNLNNRYVSHQLLDAIDFEFASYKSLKQITIN